MVCALVAGYFMIVYRTPDYQPKPLKKQELKQAVARVDKTYQDFYNNVYRMKRFRVRMDEEFLNKLLLHKEIWQNFAVTAEYSRMINKAMAEADRWMYQRQVRMTKEGVYLMGQVRYNDVSALMTIVFKPEMTKEGRLKIRLLSVKIGAMPLPAVVWEERLKELLEGGAAKKESGNSLIKKDLSSDITEKVLPVARELVVKKQVVMNTVFKPVVDRRSRITGVKLGRGWMDLEIEPLTKGK